MLSKRKNYVPYLFAGVVGILILLSGGALLLYHHFTDYDISRFLLKAHLPMIQALKSVSALPQIHHVFVIVEENHDWQGIYKNPDAPFINNTLLSQGAFAQTYYNVPKNLNALHPSEPNYLMLEAGKIAFSDHTFTTDNPPGGDNSTSSHDHIIYLLEKNNLSWKSYQEDIAGTDCPIASIGNYAPKHNPFIFFQDVSGNPPSNTNPYCIQHIRPVTELQKDLESNRVANYTFIIPNLQNDMHNGSIAQADSWLSTVVPMIMNSPAFKKDGVLFITWDEGHEIDNGNSPIGMIALSPFGKKNYTNSIEYSHPSLVKTVEEIFHLSPLVGLAADPKVSDLSNFFQIPGL